MIQRLFVISTAFPSKIYLRILSELPKEKLVSVRTICKLTQKFILQNKIAISDPQNRLSGAAAR